jgi:hypothetical protein
MQVQLRRIRTEVDTRGSGGEDHHADADSTDSSAGGNNDRSDRVESNREENSHRSTGQICNLRYIKSQRVIQCLSIREERLTFPMNGFAVPDIRLVTTPIVPITACCSKPEVANG